MREMLDTIAPASRVIRLIVGAIGGGCIVTALYALQVPGRFFAVFSVAMAIAGAATITGALVGFVFGIPRSLQGTDAGATAAPVSGAPAAPAKATSGARPEPGYRPNTSLEQISDWLTKILVGVGLTQLMQVPSALESYAAHVGKALGPVQGADIFVGATSLYFVVSGFLGAYLWTRLKLGQALSEADVVTRAELEQEKQWNAKALTLVETQLQKGTPAPDEAELTKAIAEADDLYRSHIFDRARGVRREAADKGEGKQIERTIPIFRALIQKSPTQFHQNYAQLGYALLEKDPPELEDAEANLTKAIDMRGPWEQFGYEMYELARVRCRIERTATDAQGHRVSGPTQKEHILSDLRVLEAIHDRFVNAQTRDLVQQWVKANHAADQLGPLAARIQRWGKAAHNK